MSLKYLIIGNGYIGNYLKQSLPNATLIKNKIYSEQMIKDLLLKHYPSHVLINCAGKTGRPNIDWCEDNRAETFGANVGLPVMIAEVCQEIKQYWVHIGSGCIYDGYEKAYHEEDEPNYYGSFYSKTKIWSQDILSDYDECLVLRIRMPIDEAIQSRSIINKLVGYAKEGRTILDEPNSMTVLSDLSDTIAFLTEYGETGLWNVVNGGSISASRILDLWKKYVDEELEYVIAPTNEVIATMKAGRSNCLLSGKKLAERGLPLTSIEDRVEQIIKEYGKLSKQEAVNA